MMNTDYTNDPVANMVIAEVARFYTIPPMQVMEKTRSHRSVRPRHVVYYVLHELGYCYVGIGKLFGYDHTTIINGVRASLGLRERNDALQGFCEELIKGHGNGTGGETFRRVGENRRYIAMLEAEIELQHQLLTIHALREKLGELRHEVEVLEESTPSDNVVYMTTKEQQEKR